MRNKFVFSAASNTIQSKCISGRYKQIPNIIIWCVWIRLCAWASIGKSNLLEIVFKFRCHQRTMQQQQQQGQQPLSMCHTMCKVFAFKSIIKWWNVYRIFRTLFRCWFNVMSCHVYAMLCLCSMCRWAYQNHFLILSLIDEPIQIYFTGTTWR